MGAAIGVPDKAYSRQELGTLLNDAFSSNDDELLTIAEITKRLKKETPIVESSIDWNLLLKSPLSRDARAVECRNLFDTFDDNDDKCINDDEFVAVSLRNGISETEARETFRRMDATGSGVMTVAKFDHFIYLETLRLVAETFKDVDTERDRHITKKELKMFYLSRGLSVAQAKASWETMNTKLDDKVSFVEWREWARTYLASAAISEHQLTASAETVSTAQ